MNLYRCICIGHREVISEAVRLKVNLFTVHQNLCKGSSIRSRGKGKLEFLAAQNIRFIFAEQVRNTLRFAVHGEAGILRIKDGQRVIFRHRCSNGYLAARLELRAAYLCGNRRCAFGQGCHNAILVHGSDLRIRRRPNKRRIVVVSRINICANRVGIAHREFDRFVAHCNLRDIYQVVYTYFCRRRVISTGVNRHQFEVGYSHVREGDFLPTVDCFPRSFCNLLIGRAVICACMQLILGDRAVSCSGTR